MDNKELVSRFFVEGYINHNYDFIMECMAEDYIDHSPAGARSNADAVGILKIVEGQFSDRKLRCLMYLVRRIWLQPEFSIRVFMPELVWEYRLPESILALRHWRTLGLWTARLLNHGAIGQIKKLKRNFDKFQ